MTPRFFRDGLAFIQVARALAAVRCRLQPKVLDWHAELLSSPPHSCVCPQLCPRGQALFGNPPHARLESATGGHGGSTPAGW